MQRHADIPSRSNRNSAGLSRSLHREQLEGIPQVGASLATSISAVACLQLNGQETHHPLGLVGEELQEDQTRKEDSVAKKNEELIPISNLGAQYLSLKREIDEAIQQVLAKQHFILGENVAALEEEIAAYCAVPHAIAVASGTDALILALKEAGVSAGDEVIVPAFTFVATADSVSLLRAIPVFADVDPVTLTIDVTSLEPLVTKATKAIIPVHLYGQPADMSEVIAFAKQHGLAVIGDTAQALGATYRGAPIASYGDFGCISFFPSKNLGAYGDGGMIVVKDQHYATELKMLRSHGSRVKYRSEIQGWNSRLDEIQAAVLRVKLPHLDQWNFLRTEKATLYTQLLSRVEGINTPIIGRARTHVFHQYTIRVQNRDAVQHELADAGIQTAVHYPIPLHLQPMFKHLKYKRGDLPVAELAAEQVLSLPMYPELQVDQIHRVCKALSEAVERTADLTTS